MLRTIGEILQPATQSLLQDSKAHLTTDEDAQKFVKCEFCGNDREVLVLHFGEQAFWIPEMAKPCECVGYAEFQAKQEEDARKAEEAELAKKAAEKRRKIIDNSGLGERSLQKTFDNFVAKTQQNKKLWEVAKSYSECFDAMLPKRGLPIPERNGFLISGPKGVGKTHISTAIANELISKNIAVICMTERSLLGKVRHTFSSSEMDEYDVLKAYQSVPLLIIDDLGKEKATDWTLSTLYAIIDERYINAMPTIITSNYGDSSLITRLTPQGGDAITAEAIIDRFREMCRYVVLDGESWRSK